MIIGLIIFSLVIIFLLTFISLIFLGSILNNNLNKISIFECGFITIRRSRIHFSLRFFLVVLLFLIFDMEIILFVPIRICREYINIEQIVFIIVIIILILLVGLFYEWYQGVLNWI